MSQTTNDAVVSAIVLAIWEILKWIYWEFFSGKRVRERIVFEPRMLEMHALVQSVRVDLEKLRARIEWFEQNTQQVTKRDDRK
jgi:hypothetical protein